MKKVILFALLLAAVAAVSAHAEDYMHPLTGTSPYYYYNCTYTNTSLHEVDGADGGFSRFDIAPSGTSWVGSEVFLATYGPDRRKVTFAKPVNLYNPVTGAWNGTRWEFTINPYGPQCKNTVVRNWGSSISFQDCTDGSSRTCTLF